MTFAKVQSFPAMTTTHLAYNARLCAAYMGSGTISTVLPLKNFNDISIGCQRVGMPGLGSTDLNSFPMRTRRVTWIKTKRESVMCGRSGANKPSKFGLRCKANKRSDAGTGDLGVLPTQGTLAYCSGECASLA